MIKQLTIENFKSHKHTELNFVPGVNVIIGESDSGKSAIIGAFRLALKNRPSGDGYRSHWGGDVKVTVTTDEIEVERGKDKENYYKVGPLKLTAFKTEVPTEVQNALRLSDINLQTQFSSHFLLSETPGEVAVYFNRIAGIDQIDTSIKKVASWISDITSVIGHTADKNRPASGLIKQQIELQEKLLQYSHLQKMEIELEVLEEMEVRQQNIINRRSKLNSKVLAIQTTEQAIEKESVLLPMEEDIDRILVLYNHYNSIVIEADTIEALTASITNTNSKIEYYSKLSALEVSIHPLLILHEQLDEIQKKRSILNTLSFNISKTNTALQEEEEKLGRLQTILDKEMPDVCPLCDQIIPHTH